MIWRKGLLKGSLALLTLNLCCYIPFTEAATVFGVTPMGEEDSNTITVVADNNNNALAVYPDDELIFARFSPGNITWELPVQISDSLTDKLDPALAMNPNTTVATAVWIGSDGVNFTIEANRFDGTTWGTPEIIDGPTTAETFISTAVDMNGTDDAVAGWINLTTNEVFASFFESGSWQAPQLIGALGYNGLDLAYSPDGTVAAAWTRIDPGFFNELYVNSFDGTSWQVAQLLDATADSFPDVGIDANGNAIVIWTGNLNGEVRVSYFDGTTWGPIQTLSLAGGNSTPVIAVDPDGTAIALWQDAGLNIQMAQFDGTTWGPAFPIAVGESPAITLDNEGNALIAYSNNDELFVRYLPKGGVLGEPILVDDALTGYSNIDLALSSASNLGVAGWTEGTEGTSTFATFILFDPFPAGPITGFSCNNTFATQSERINFISWAPSLDPTVIAYYVFRNGELVAIVPASGPLEFVDRNRSRKVADTYTVYSVNAEGFIGVPVSITLN